MSAAGPSSQTPVTAPDPEHPRVGDEILLEIGPVAHGGHCVARWAGRVVFVRHALPGEQALVRLTDTRHGGFLRADAIRIDRADEARIAPRCFHFGPGGCGGCDFQHATLQRQRELKAAVVAEQLRRLAALDVAVAVEELPGAGDGFGWRTRVRWGLDATGRIGPRATRSHDVVAISSSAPCEIAAPGISETAAALGVPPEVALERMQGAMRPRDRGGVKLPEVNLVRTGAAPLVLWKHDDVPTITEHAAGHDFQVRGDGFWQVHPAAADTLAAAVDDAVDGLLAPGGVAWDLYGGVGLFGAVLADRVGPSGTVVTVENDAPATALALSNLDGLAQIVGVSDRVEQLLEDPDGPLGGTVDVIVLDPPRSGAGRVVCAEMTARSPAAIVYVACDPAALARDTAILAEHGYRLDSLRAFDCFPQTHHVECVARFLPA